MTQGNEQKPRPSNAVGHAEAEFNDCARDPESSDTMHGILPWLGHLFEVTKLLGTIQSTTSHPS